MTTLLFSLSDIFFSFFLFFFCYFPSLLIFFSDISFSLLFSFLFIFLLCYFPSFFYFPSVIFLLSDIFLPLLLFCFSSLIFLLILLLYYFPFPSSLLFFLLWCEVWQHCLLCCQGCKDRMWSVTFLSFSLSRFHILLLKCFFFSLINCSVLFPLAFTFLTVNNRLGGSSVYLFQFLSVFRQLPRF